MLTLRRPNPRAVQELLEGLRDAPLSYDCVGCIDGPTPRGFVRDEAECVLGFGPDTWQAACAAMREWRMFPEAMVSVIRTSDEIEPGTLVAVMAKAFGVHAVCPARVLHRIERGGEAPAFGFTYGTLPGHVAHGEERFLVEWNPATDAVRFRIVAVSRLAHPLLRIARPWMRLQQARFRRLARQSMRAAVAERTSVACESPPRAC